MANNPLLDRVFIAGCVTSDLERQKNFYACLFDWTYEPLESAIAREVVIAKKNGIPTAAFASLPSQPHPFDTEPNWRVVISVDDVDAYAEKAVKLGGEIAMAPHGEGERRSCILKDPDGLLIVIKQAPSMMEKKEPGKEKKLEQDMISRMRRLANIMG
ncbi:VOC family protein [Desulfovibrio inopinatus]|uniref:VOC family protein n=1 Tax=Desulfovibrio inopinatus TaxID=102109 RepID=UPI000408D414|nr:VOC family protein [Desulfovibrio inopinatus]